MSLILTMLGRNEIKAGPLQDISWWGNVGSTSSGVSVGPDTALKLSTVWACVGLLAETVASMPLIVYQWLPNDSGKKRARNHPLYGLLHQQPNEQQTAFEFWQMMMGHLLLRGNAYARIVPGPRGFVDQLVPLHPDLVQVEELTNGRLRYKVQNPSGRTDPYNQEDILHLRGLSLDGKTGLSVIDYARESMGIGLAAEKYGGRFFRNDSRPGGVLRTPKTLTKDAATRLKGSWEAAHSAGNQNRVAVLEEGLEWQQIGISPDQAQFLQTREFQSEDVCRWFRTPPHMVGLTSKATSWGSGIEQMGIGFVTYTLMPWLVRIRQAISRSLILAPDRYFADFVVEALLRGDTNDRYSAYSIGVQWGWLSPNDVRRLENMNARPGGDAYLTPLNMTSSDQAAQQATSPHYRLLAEEAAGRVVRKEIAAMSKAWSKHSEDKAAWETAVTDFYHEHAALVAQTMRISLETAVSYCNEQAHLINGMGLTILLENEAKHIAYLAALAVKNE